MATKLFSDEEEFYSFNILNFVALIFSNGIGGKTYEKGNTSCGEK